MRRTRKVSLCTSDWVPGSPENFAILASQEEILEKKKKRSFIVALALRGSIWPFLEKCRCVPKMGFREIEKIEKLTKSLKDLALQD